MFRSGDVAQLGERYVRNVQVVGSNPIISTTFFSGRPIPSATQAPAFIAGDHLKSFARPGAPEHGTNRNH